SACFSLHPLFSPIPLFAAATQPNRIGVAPVCRLHDSHGRDASCVRHAKRSRHLPLSPREERAGRESERGVIDKKRLLSPGLSSFFEEERERKRGCALKANLLPNTTGGTPVPIRWRRQISLI